MPATIADRERRHHASLEAINRIQCLVGQADRSRVDQVGTLLERARQVEAELRAHEATEQGLAAFDRLLRIVEEKPAQEWRAVAAFLRAIWNGEALPLGLLRLPGDAIGDDMLAVLNAWRIARLDLVSHVQGGAIRVARALSR